ncbi:MAG: aminopeptidase P family protein, partial [Deltaproteobacteria bacterium]|nr:aminopeptidase P family protein [Deltaproteobacteria bacterium]
LKAAGVEISGQEIDLVEQVWGEERPAMPKAALRAHPTKYAGETVADKLKRIRTAMRETDAGALAVGALDEIAWALNLRGADVDFNPVFISFLLVEEKKARLFVDTSKLSEELKASLPADLSLEDYPRFGQALARLGAEGRAVWMDPQTHNQHSRQEVIKAGGRILADPSPISAWKAIKNQAELEGFRAAHHRDALAMVKFLRWLETAVPAGELTELSAAARLGEFRAEAPEYIGPSFETISGYGPHGAIVHYRVNAESDIPLKTEGIYLVDSGGQYEDGTTDITRTMALGTPTAMHKKAYTAVLRGHLQLFRSLFPEGTDGYQLDVLARAPVWAAGLNYGHGTGHGVGAALCVHEGPFSVSPRKNMTALAAGHVLSIEPGYYKTDDFGMRIENLAVVVEVEQNESGNFLGFKPLTLCPYERQLIDKKMLNPTEIEQINDYHKTVLDVLSEELDEAHRAWLTQACRPL